jgi:hypothetical protein
VGIFWADDLFGNPYVDQGIRDFDDLLSKLLLIHDTAIRTLLK